MFRSLIIIIVLSAAVYGLMQAEVAHARCDVSDIIYHLERDRSRSEIRERCDDEIDVSDCSLSHVIRMVKRMLEDERSEREIIKEVYETCGRR